MPAIGAAFYELKDRLQPLYDEREAAAIAHGLIEHITGMSRLGRLTHKDEHLTDTQTAEYERVLPLALQGVPMQYITGRAWFMGEEYVVNANVLIPRPETEELVEWIADDHRNAKGPLRILDAGTGSGCIPIALKKELPWAEVTACDISAGALDVARQNAKNLHADVSFMQVDILNKAAWQELGMYDIIVSNPPYIPQAEAERLHANVRGHEPWLALFVPDDDALVFYRALAQMGHTHLTPSGRIYCELDTDHALQTAALFVQEGYAGVHVRKDIHGNNRMLVAHKAF
ncbi:peptide chain release factor N(5)-glutamine methyltransferase [Nemorincola caseinilytica]|uniref:Release factor glutamine methyltransferase n=1 Tax=Nemorincola caseinilytica TaxID=2054315 RepID=A0ABP8NNP4_9BACT